MLNTKLVVIELTDEDANPFFNSADEIYNFLIKMNINQPRVDDIDSFPTCPEVYNRYSFANKLWMASVYAAITGTVWWKVWLNPENGYVIAYQDYEGKKFTDNFIRYVENVPSLDTGDLPCNLGNKTFINKTNLNLDTILEKIFTQGLGELSIEEVNFLGDISKDL